MAVLTRGPSERAAPPPNFAIVTAGPGSWAHTRTAVGTGSQSTRSSEGAVTCYTDGPRVQPRLPHAGASARAQSPSHALEDTDHPGSSSKGQALGMCRHLLQTSGPPRGVPHDWGPHRASHVDTRLPCPRALSQLPWAGSQDSPFSRDPGCDRRFAGVQVPSFPARGPVSGDRSACS